MTCFDCGVRIQSVVYTGTLLCGNCFEKMKQRLKIITGSKEEFIVTKTVDKEAERIAARDRLEEGKKMLAETDLPVVEIARRTGANLANLYYHSGNIRKKDNEVKEKEPKKLVKKVSEKRVDWKKKYDVLLKKYDEIDEKLFNSERDKEALEQEIESLDQMVSRSGEVILKERNEVGELNEQVRELTEKLLEMKQIGEKKNIGIQEPKKRPVPANDVDYKHLYELEKKKHELLVSYLELLRTEVD